MNPFLFLVWYGIDDTTHVFGDDTYLVKMETQEGRQSESGNRKCIICHNEDGATLQNLPCRCTGTAAICKAGLSEDQCLEKWQKSLVGARNYGGIVQCPNCHCEARPNLSPLENAKLSVIAVPMMILRLLAGILGLLLGIAAGCLIGTTMIFWYIFCWAKSLKSREIAMITGTVVSTFLLMWIARAMGQELLSLPVLGSLFHCATCCIKAKKKLDNKFKTIASLVHFFLLEIASAYVVFLFWRYLSVEEFVETKLSWLWGWLPFGIPSMVTYFVLTSNVFTVQNICLSILSYFYSLFWMLYTDAWKSAFLAHGGNIEWERETRCRN